MHPVAVAHPQMLEGLEDYNEPVRALIKASGRTKGIAYVTVDEKIVMPGMSQRRPGPHVDGCFMPIYKDWSHGPSWNHGCNNLPVPRMSVIVAASVAGCKAWVGEFDAEPQNDGDLSHIQDQLGEGVILEPNTGYMLSPDCIHESMIFEEATKRTFLRIALPV